MNLFFDIETIPSQKPGVLDEIRATIKPPATYKKPESIAEWMAEHAEAVAQEKYREGALDASRGEVISIAWAFEDQAPRCLIRLQGESEAGLLTEFWQHVDDHLEEMLPAGVFIRDDLIPIAHNAAWDIGFLRRRSWVNCVKPVKEWPRITSSFRDYGCTMTEWAGLRDRISLDNLCKALGVETSKGDMDGSKVYDAWMAGEYDRIAEYNRADVAAMRECWYRMR